MYNNRCWVQKSFCDFQNVNYKLLKTFFLQEICTNEKLLLSINARYAILHGIHGD